MDYHTQEQTIQDTDDITGSSHREEGVFNMNAVNLPQDFTDDHKEGLRDYIDTMSRIRHKEYQIEFSSEWENRQIEMAREEMDSGDRQNYGLDLPFFHFQHPDGTTRHNFHTWENNDQVQGALPPYMERLHDEIEESFSNNSTNHSYWLSDLGLADDHPFINEIDEEIAEKTRDMENFDGSYGYWREDWGRNPPNHPNFDFHRDEMIEQEGLLEDEDGDVRPPDDEEDDDGLGYAYERVYGDNAENVAGFRTSAEEMNAYKGEIEALQEMALKERNDWLSQFQAQVINDENITQEEQDERDGTGDLVALPSRRLTDRNEDRDGTEDTIKLGKRIQIKKY
jgi:hypothetical protein